MKSLERERGEKNLLRREKVGIVAEGRSHGIGKGE